MPQYLTRVSFELCQAMSPSLQEVLVAGHSHNDILEASKTVSCCLLRSESG